METKDISKNKIKGACTRMNKQDILSMATKLGLSPNSSLGDIRTAFNKLIEQEIELEKNPPKSPAEKFMEDFESDGEQCSWTEVSDTNELADIFLYCVMDYMTDEEKEKAKKVTESDFKDLKSILVTNLNLLEKIIKINLNGNTTSLQKVDSIKNLFLNDLKDSFLPFF